MATNHTGAVALHDARRRRLAAAGVVQRMFPELRGVCDRLRTPISRARNGYANPVERLVDYLVEARRVGADRERAENLLAFIEAIVEELWPAEEIDLRAAMLREQEAEGRANVLQMRAMDEPAVLSAWVEAELAENAASRVAIAAARACTATRRAA